MKRKFTLIAAAVVILFAVFGLPNRVWATDVTFSYSDYKGQGTSSTGSEYTMVKTDVSITNTKFYCGSSSSYAQFYAGGTSTITPGENVTITQIVLTASSTGYNGYQTGGEITASTGSVSGSGTTVTWTGEATSAFTISNNKQIRWTSIVVTYTGGGPALEDNDLALTGAPIALSFDLYNNSDAQTVSFTTSSTGAVTVSASEYVSTSVSGNTITVTPEKVTPSAQTITVNQAADDTYNAGSATFTVNITDSTPFNGVIFDATTDQGTSPIVKDNVSLACTNGVLNNGSEYRFYKNSTTTLSTNDGSKITKIEFTGVSGNPASGFATQSGWTTSGNDGVWEGEAESVSFVASGAQVRATVVKVSILPSTTPNITANDVNIAYDATGGSITYTIVNYVSGTTTIASQTAWLAIDQDPQVSETGTFAFTCEANDGEERTATARLTFTYGTESVTKDVTVTQAANPNTPGTENNPYTVAQARAAIDAGTGITGVYATGIVCTGGSSLNNGAMNYWISDDGTETDRLEAYRGKGLNGANFTSTDEVQVGDVVVIFGDLTKYNTTYEFASGNYLVSITGAPSITASNLDIACNATSGSVPYTINKSVTGGILSCSVAGGSSSWITSTTVEDDAVTFVCSANTGAERTETLTLTYTYNTSETVTKTVTVTQAELVAMYTINFELDGGTFVPNADFDADIVEKPAGTYNLPSATKAGWEFAGWNDGDNTYAANDEYEITDHNVEFTAQWTEITTGTINFGSATGSTAINAASVTGTDNMGNTWTITTTGTTSFTQNASYSQVGKGTEPASTITFTTTLPAEALITDFSAKFGGFSGTAGSISLKVGTTAIGTGALNAGTDVIVSNTSTARGTVLTVSVTGIDKGVKCYYISYTVNTSTAPIITAPSSISLGSLATSGEIAYEIANPATGVSLTAASTDSWISGITVTPDKVTFTTTPNTSTTDDRVGTITLSYTGADDKVVTITQSKVDYATLPFAYDGNGSGTLPTGLTKNGLGTYDSSPAMKFDGTGDYLILKLNEAPASLSYVIKGNTFSGGTFKVQTSADGVTYEDLASYTDLGDLQYAIHFDLTSTVRYIKWIYTNKSSGNVALGNIHASANYDIYGDVTVAYLNIPMDKVCTIYSGATLEVTYVNGLSNEGNASNLVIKDGAQLKTPNAVLATVEKNIIGYGAGNVNTNLGYYLVSAPAKTYLAIDTQNPDPNVDAYHFDAYYEGAEWRNFKTATGPWHVAANSAVLYATKENSPLSLNGYAVVSGNPGYNEVPATTAPVNVEVKYNTGKAFAGFNLIGNPFTCTAYLTDGRDFYRMNSDRSDLILNTETGGGGNAIGVCEGIFVQCTTTGSVAFTTDPSTVTSVGPNNSMITLNLTQNRGALVDNARIRFGEGNNMTKFMLNGAGTKLYIPQGGKDYAVVRSEAQGELPLNFKAEKNGTYTLSIDIDADMDYLHLIDNMTGADIDLLQTPSYTFDAHKSDYASRFRLVFSANGVNDNQEGGNANFAYINGEEIVILNAEANATLQVVDLTGRIVSSTNVAHSVSTAGMVPGVYVLRLINGTDVKVQKIVVE